MEVSTVTKSGTKATLKGLPCDEITITIPQGVFAGYWGKLGSVDGFVCRGKINGKDTQICAQIPRSDWDNLVDGIKSELSRNVPGLDNLTATINAEVDYIEAFDAMMDDEQNDGINPPKAPIIKAKDIAAQYPIAAAYLKAEKFENSNHYAKSSAGKAAKKTIAQGGDYVAAIAKMENEWNDHCTKSID